jgi:predicted O-methyltransferase YrrM
MPTTERGVPQRVRDADEHARRCGFALSCLPQVGRLLASLAATKPAGRIAESGTGCGVGTAWLHSGMAAEAALWTVERDESLAAAVADRFADDPRVQVLAGDWTLLEAHAPFDLLFCDGGGKRDAPDRVVDLLAPGGILVLDDFAPQHTWPPMYDGAVDELRVTYLTHPAVVATEVQLTPSAAAVVAVRR